MTKDVLYHFGFSTDKDDLVALFNDVKFVLCGGSAGRMLKLATFLCKQLNNPNGDEPTNLTRTDRYVLYKVSNCICVSHGIGFGSMLVMLHEITKLLRYAKASDPIIIRVGTSGGIGIPAGTVVISNGAVNGLLKPIHEFICAGQRLEFPTELDDNLAKQLNRICSQLNFPCIIGRTMGCNDFYEEQGRMDGAFCAFSLQQRQQFLQHAKELGICNIDMEASCFSAFCRRAKLTVGLILQLFITNYKGAIVNVTLMDRLTAGDQLIETKEIYLSWEERPFAVVAEFVKQFSN